MMELEDGAEGQRRWTMELEDDGADIRLMELKDD